MRQGRNKIGEGRGDNMSCWEAVVHGGCPARKRQRSMREKPKEKREEGGRRGDGARQFLAVAIAAPPGKLQRKNTGEEEVLRRLGWRRSRGGVVAACGWNLVVTRGLVWLEI